MKPMKLQLMAINTNIAASTKKIKEKGHKIELTDLNGQGIEIPRIKVGINELDRVLGGDWFAAPRL
jgi:predicted ATP-dependent serine protease